jgi:hypothetical protein
LSYATTLQAHRTKYNSRARKCVFIGYKDGTKGYILYDLHSHDFFVSRNVVFYENHFPFKDSSASLTVPTTTLDDPLDIPPTSYDESSILPTIHDNNITDINPIPVSPASMPDTDIADTIVPSHVSVPSTITAPTPSPNDSVTSDQM